MNTLSAIRAVMEAVNEGLLKAIQATAPKTNAVPAPSAIKAYGLFVVPETPTDGPPKLNYIPPSRFTKAYAAAPVPDRPDAMFGYQEVWSDRIFVNCRTNIPEGDFWAELQEEYRESEPIWKTKQSFEISGPIPVSVGAFTDALRRWRLLLQPYAEHLNDVARYWSNSIPEPHAP